MKARLGQNFLVDAQAQRAIADALGDISKQRVLEIGPGKGAITDLLARRAGELIAIELDRDLASALRTRFLTSANVQVIEQDILKVDLTELAGLHKLFVIGNLPYYITSDILLHLCAHAAAISRAVIMVQREVADRIVAQPGTRDFGMLSATCQLYARVERLMNLPPEAFSPPPEVHSSVVRMSFAPRFEELHVEPQAFLAYLKQCFAQKRKTLANNLRAAGYAAEVVESALKLAGVKPQARAETLSVEEQARVFQELQV